MLLEELPPVLFAHSLYSDQSVPWSGVPEIVPESEIESPEGRSGSTSQVSMEGPEYWGWMDMLSFEASANSSSDHVTAWGGRSMMWKDTCAESPPAELFAHIVW